MDEVVRRAIAKWPNVPAVYEWLALDRRGRWLLRGESIDNPVVTAFIARNYEHDPRGQWYFQNGPQRVFVDLEYTPIVVRVADDSGILTHTGRRVCAIDGAWIDESGRMLIATEHGPALVDDRDIESFWSIVAAGGASVDDDDQVIAAIEELQRGGVADLRIHYGGKTLPLKPIASAAVPTSLGFIAHPRPAAQPPCT